MTSVAVPDNGLDTCLASIEGTWLGFDYGKRRTGVAVGQTTTGTATPLAVVHQGSEARDWQPFEKIIREWRPRGMVVGLPLGSDGESTNLSREARRFGNQLSAQVNVPVFFQDERLTSKAAEAQFAQRRRDGAARRKDARLVDAMAAAVILENWLQSHSNGS